MTSFRFELHESMVTKHHLSKDLDWTQAARFAFDNKLDQSNVAITKVRQLDADTIEVTKRIDQNLGIGYKWFGSTQEGLYERATINRRTGQVAIDRMDGSWWHDEAFIGRRDTFYKENRAWESSNNGKLAFVRHDYWLPITCKFWSPVMSHFARMSYKSGIAKQPTALK